MRTKEEINTEANFLRSEMWEAFMEASERRGGGISVRTEAAAKAVSDLMADMIAFLSQGDRDKAFKFIDAAISSVTVRTHEIITSGKYPRFTHFDEEEVEEPLITDEIVAAAFKAAGIEEEEE